MEKLVKMDTHFEHLEKSVYRGKVTKKGIQAD
jgi:hypothetical protein